MKNFSVLIPRNGKRRPTVLRKTTTLQHAIKHAAYASELRIPTVVKNNRTGTVVLSIPPIDKSHAVKPTCKRDRRYRRIARKS